MTVWEELKARGLIAQVTNEEEIKVKTETLSIKASPLMNGLVKARTVDATTETVYNNWYKSVYIADSENVVQTSSDMEGGV